MFVLRNCLPVCILEKESIMVAMRARAFLAGTEKLLKAQLFLLMGPIQLIMKLMI